MQGRGGGGTQGPRARACGRGAAGGGAYGCGVGRGGPSRGPAGGRRGTVMGFGGQPPPVRTGRSQKMVFLGNVHGGRESHFLRRVRKVPFHKRTHIGKWVVSGGCPKTSFWRPAARPRELVDPVGSRKWLGTPENPRRTGRAPPGHARSTLTDEAARPEAHELAWWTPNKVGTGQKCRMWGYQLEQCQAERQWGVRHSSVGTQAFRVATIILQAMRMHTAAWTGVAWKTGATAILVCLGEHGQECTRHANTHLMLF